MPQPARPVCETKKVLLGSYEALLEQYLSRLQKLQAHLATSPKKEYERLRDAVEEGRLKSEAARIALQEHIREHGC